ncbi:MAG: hypothetical protein Q4Q24_01720 [Methanobrevibacter ruminantium]|uniref:hypothetical protein n=1 Tax=Methanobrevibacter ruminantium TaxID=83816 RepID=UPI0026EF1B57|nr:hypothetical protein [Methanobrevibacter ruminantium]MDO5841974.1 hypothetical protein [Methanobrevibacter ruminantium]
MSSKNYYEKYLTMNILIGSGIVLIILLIIYIIMNFLSIKNFNDQSIISIINISATLIIGLLSFIGVMINLKHNYQIMEYTEKSEFVQLRFKDSKKAIYELFIFIQITLVVYKDIKSCYDNDSYEETKILYLDPRSFLIMQFIQIISNTYLLNNLPKNLRHEFEYKFANRVNNVETIDSKKSLKKILEYKHLILNYIPHINEYEKFIEEFRNDIFIDNKSLAFESYYCSDIKEEELLNNFTDIFNRIEKEPIKDIILKDMDLKRKETNFKEIFGEK